MFFLYNADYFVLIIYILAAIVPAVLLITYIYKQDKIEKEPFRLLLNLFLLGVFSALPAILLEMIADSSVIVQFPIETQFQYGVLTALFTGLIEEGCKFFFLYKKTWKNWNFNYTFDGIVYSVTVSLGFAAIENVIYVLNYGLNIAFTRALTALPGHMCFAVFMGYFYSKAKEKSARLKSPIHYLCLSYLSAVLFHTVYDATLMVEDELSSSIFIIFVICMYFIVYKRIKKASRNDLRI